jgi:choline dehydrogenase
VVTRALVERVEISEEGVATGVTYRDGSGSLVTSPAAREVILSAGSVGSPQTLMLSGVGPRAQLDRHGVKCRVDLPGVGASLNDHPDLVMKWRCTQPVTLYPQTRPLASLAAGVQWLLTRRGICASNHFDVVACVRSSPDVEYPDLQFTLSPIAMDDLHFEPLQEHAFQMHVGLMRAYSRGVIELRDADPASPPRILCNYLDDPRDIAAMRRGVRMLRDLTRQPAFEPLCGEELFPGEAVQTDEELDAAIRSHTVSQWHLTSTARMGARSDPTAVVDGTGRVYGVDRLRVVDASIMPFATNGNTNCPTIMIAEKLSEAILATG